MLVQISSFVARDDDTGISGTVWAVDINGKRWYCGDDKPDRAMLKRILSNASREHRVVLTDDNVRVNTS